MVVRIPRHGIPSVDSTRLATYTSAVTRRQTLLSSQAEQTWHPPLVAKASTEAEKSQRTFLARRRQRHVSLRAFQRYSSRIGVLRELRRLCCRLTSPSEHELDVVRAAEHRSIALALAFARFRLRLQASALFLLLRRRGGDDSFRFRSGLSGGTRSRPCTAGLFLVLR